MPVVLVVWGEGVGTHEVKSVVVWLGNVCGLSINEMNTQDDVHSAHVT